MEVIELNSAYVYNGSSEKQAVKLPLCAADSNLGGFVFTLPAGKGTSYLDISETGGYVDVMSGGERVATVSGVGRSLIDVSECLSRRTELSMNISGGSLKRGVKLFTSHSRAHIVPYGLFACMGEVSELGAKVNVHVEVGGITQKRKLCLEVCIVSGKARRIGRRKKVFTVLPGSKTIKLEILVRRPVFYTEFNPKMVALKAVLKEVSGEELDTAVQPFGMVNRGLLDLTEKLVGTVVPHSSGITGGISYPEAEKRKLAALRDLGYNTLRYIGLPSDTALSVADELGLKVIVDIFDNWSYPRGNGLSHIAFIYERARIAENAIKTLRNHPSVIMYSIGNCLEESYGRAGAASVQEITELVRRLDPYRLITAAMTELVPTLSEAESMGVKVQRLREYEDKNAGLVALSRERDLFKRLTQKFSSHLSAVGYSHMPPPEPSERLSICTAADAMLAAEWAYAAEVSDNIIGYLSSCGIASSGVQGDLDATCLPTPSGNYFAALANKQISLITTTDDDFFSFSNCHSHWNYSEGKKVLVTVLTSGDVVALYLNGRLIGRKLAGKINKNLASFSVEYQSGRLEAVSYLHGKEISRAELETSGEPYSIKLLTGTRKIADGEIAYVDAWVLDRSGRIAAHSASPIAFSASGGEVIAAGGSSGLDCDGQVVCSGGHALIAMRGKGERIFVTAKANGLRSGRITINVK